MTHDDKSSTSPRPIARRDFLQGAAIAAFVVAFLSLPFATRAQEPAQIPRFACQDFQRSAPGASAAVQEYLDHSDSALVHVCNGGSSYDYYEMSRASKRGDVCRVIGHTLASSRSSPRLERTNEPPVTYMLVTKSACPLPTRGRYAAIRDVAEDQVIKLSRLWRDAVSSPEAFHGISGISDDAARLLRTKIAQGKGGDLAITSIHRAERFYLLKQNYGLIVGDLADPQLSYYVTVGSWFGGMHAISKIDLAVP